MLPIALQARARLLAEAVVRPLAAGGITPNTVTVAGFILNILTAAILATGRLTLGGALLLLAGLFDMLDGALARVSRRQSTFGAFLDSLLDRYSEAAVLLALLFVFTRRHDTVTVLLIYAVAIGSLLISYARARAEGLGLECKVGIAARPERIIILGLGLIFGGATTIAALVVLALLTHFTAMQRLYHVWRQTQGGAAGEAPTP
ncbi:MAG: CDP-alcohol phosphatidyltransferase family protein [Chloroflexota bacterium]|nr:CDP-alcohol phosphatidyltransferase family protein [Chloroflexota bacterium]